VTRRGRPAQELRAAIDRLPLDVRRAMLDGLAGNRIIAGAQGSRDGGVCPLVAAGLDWQHMERGRYEVALEMARAWDRYTDTRGRTRPATRRQLIALRAMLEASLMEAAAAAEVPFERVIAEHTEATAQRAPQEPAAGRRRLDTGERSRLRELGSRASRSWTRPFTSVEEYEATMRLLVEAGELEPDATLGAGL
jgi:hypothetical protein